MEAYEIDLSGYERIVFGFPVWASQTSPRPLRTFIVDNREKLKGKTFFAFACQSGAGAEKVLKKLSACLETESFERTAVFIDPKAKHTDDKDAQIDAFCAAF